MSSTHYMAHQLRLPPSFSIQQRYIATLFTITHLICHITAVVSPFGQNHSVDISQFNVSYRLLPNPTRSSATRMEGWPNQATLVVMNSEESIKEMGRTFKEYLTMFNITLNRDVDFVRGEGLSTLLWQAENSKYSRVIYVLDGRNASDSGYCDMAESLSQSFNKTIIIWPCPKMETPQNALPSYETISFAVKSISQEFNWTEAVIFVAGTNWGLPLAIAANLHVRCRIEFNYTSSGQIDDKLGAAVIITSPMESIATQRLLHKLRSFIYTKVLVIDITGGIFSRANYFGGYLTTKEELDYIFEHWSENNYYSTSSSPYDEDEEGSARATEQNNKTRVVRSALKGNASAEKVTDTEGGEGPGPEVLSEISPSVHKTETKLKRVNPKFVVDPKPQNFLILTVLTEKLKSFHNTALHVEFEQYYKLSRSGVVEPFVRRPEQQQQQQQQPQAEVITGHNDYDSVDRSSSNNRNEDRPRKQMKRSEETIVTVNGTRNCNTTVNQQAVVTGSTSASSKANVGYTGVPDSDCAKNNGKSGKHEKERLLISKLPIFTSLTSSINESIQLLLIYTAEKNCTLFGVDGASASECASALKCSSVSDANEQLFCNYLCQMAVNYSLGKDVGNGATANLSDSLPVIVGEEVIRRFVTPTEVIIAVEHICQQLSVDWSGRIRIQMEFSENLLYFYNENVVSKNNELVKRHKSKPMPIPLTQKPAAKNSPESKMALHRRLKRDNVGAALQTDRNQSRTQQSPSSREDTHHHRKVDDDDDAYSDVKVTAEQKGHRSKLATAASHYAKYSEYFSLFDCIVDEQEKLVDRHDFIILDFKNTGTASAVNETGFGWRPFLIMQQSVLNPQVFTTYSILPGYNDWTLIPTQNFMDCGLLCMGVIVLAFVILCSITVGGIVSAITIRNYLLKKRLSKGPNKVVLSAVDFVFPVDSRRVDEGIEAMLCCFLQQLQEFGGPEVEKPDVIKGSMSSLKNAGLATAQNKNTSGSGSLARHNTVLDMRARYNGDLVQLKEIAMLTGTELKTKTMDHLVMSHGLRHENINPFIGWLSDSNRTAMVFEYCSRGSLQDVLIMDDIKLDWSFRLSLLTDLVRGMRYLHSSPLRVHGRLTSRNCVVDARWVLKITDYGMSSFYDTIGLTAPIKSAKELLWTAPEALRNTKGFPKCGTQMGDVYSFGIIMQEVVVRGEPYCMLSLSPEEIIAKIKKPPPLIRPSVSKGAAPPEAINIMRQCWAEMPDMRPDFNTVYERFKQLNHGRKVNFVDTMFQMLEKYSNNLEELIRERTDQLDMERKKTEQLLNRMLPNTVAEKLKVGLSVEPEEFAEVTIYFSDIVGFTTIAAHCSPVQVVDLLNDLYTCFDATINAYHVYKVETIGDAYMVVSGLPSRVPDHAEQIATMALDLLHESGRFRIKHLPGVPLQLRIGLHSGPCCAGVVGLTMPRYCLFGDTVNTASRMESTGSSWRIHLSESTRDRLVAAGGYHIDSRGLIDIKGKGMMNTYWLLGKKGFDKPLPDPPPIGESHGLDESLIRNSVQVSQLIEPESPEGDAVTITATRTDNYDTVEVKVEITPPAVSNCEQQQQQLSYVEPCPPVIATSISLDSTTGQATLSFSQQDFPPRASVSLASPQQRKMSEFSQDSLLNPTGFTRMTPSPGANSSRLFKKIEEMMDLSSPYNHYRCLSSESNLALGSALQNLATLGGNLSVASPAMMNSFTVSLTVPEDGSAKLNATKSFDRNCGSGVGAGASTVVDGSSRPGSGRLLRRQFSLDKDDLNNNSAASATLSNNLGNSACLQAGGKPKTYLEGVPADAYQKHSSLPSISGQTLINKLQQTANKTLLYKHNSSSISQDLEKIEEVPGSPNEPLLYSGQQQQHQRRANHAPLSQSSLTNSIPFIDCGSCSSSVSTIPSSILGSGAAPISTQANCSKKDSTAGDTNKIEGRDEGGGGKLEC